MWSGHCEPTRWQGGGCSVWNRCTGSSSDPMPAGPARAASPDPADLRLQGHDASSLPPTVRKDGRDTPATPSRHRPARTGADDQSLRSQHQSAPDHRASGGAIAVLMVWHKPGEGPPDHVHFSQDEIFFIVEGTYELTMGDQTSVDGPSTIVFIPRNVVHRFK